MKPHRHTFTPARPGTLRCPTCQHCKFYPPEQRCSCGFEVCPVCVQTIAEESPGDYVDPRDLEDPARDARNEKRERNRERAR